MGTGGLSPIEWRREFESARARRRIERQPQAETEPKSASSGMSLEPMVIPRRVIAALTLLAAMGTFMIAAFGLALLILLNERRGARTTVRQE